MKKIILLLMIISTVLLSSCQSSKKITIWHDKETAVIDVIKKHIPSEIDGYEIEFVRKDSLTDTLKLVGNSPSSAPDMFIFAHDKIGVFAEIGILEPIYSFINEDALDDYIKMTKDAATYKNVVYQLPLYYETLLFMYNKDRMTEGEVPTTTEDLYEYMKENTDSRRYGFVEQYATAYYSAGWIHGFGGKILNDDGTPGLNDENTIKALEYHKKFTNYMPQSQADYATINTMFTEKRANSIIAGPWLVPQARTNNINLGFAPMPIVNETGKPVAPYAGIQGIHVLKVHANNQDKQNAFKELLDCLLNSDLGADLAVASGCAPANSNSYLNDSIKDDLLVQAMKEAADKAVPMPNMPEMDIMWQTTGTLLTQIYLNGKDIKQSANEAQEESERLINQMGNK